ncbi:MAG: inositol 2-dehydrogenase [Parcubacteria group bacterium]|nr:inositol 2-dehydrogenase [Parcubacteria group bacterium]|tara:strand:- start:11031 stop:12035 length:1005 start_codon:yes stop_codon:yes gene_type:complete
MLNFSLMGAGRIGKMHAKNIAMHSKCNLTYIYDINQDLANEVAKQNEAQVVQSAEEAINSKDVDVVFIASATPSHIDFITMGANAGKAIFCEKPIDLDIENVNKCFETVKDIDVPIQIGFNRRFDNSHKSLKLAKDNGQIGKLEMVVITSRDPEPPGIDYLKAAGGVFRDMTIHDFDLSRFILGNDPIVEVCAYGGQLVSEECRQIGDHDTAMLIMRSQQGVLIHINNSRRAVYGYDQRLEIFGSKGMMISNNQFPTSVEVFNKNNTYAKDLIHFFFIERYDQAYKDQLDDFVNIISSNKKPSVTFEDGRNALILANAAYESLESGKSVKVNFN